MEKFITIMSFTHPSELAVLRARLEAEGIEFLVLNELTTQVNPIYSNATGGVLLQVKESDLTRSIEILKVNGYLKDSGSEFQGLFTKLDIATYRIPLLKLLRPENRLMIISAVAVLLLTGIIYFAVLPSTFDRLTQQAWCVDRVTYNGKIYRALTVKPIQIQAEGICKELIDLRTNGIIILPGFNSPAVWGRWTLEDDILKLTLADTFDFVYNGEYQIIFSDNTLILKSVRTILSCRPQKIPVNLPF
jgi:hypothetical protein